MFTDAAGNPGYWRDVGTLDSYGKAHMELLGGTRSCVMSDSLASEGCIIDNAIVIHSVLGPGVGEDSIVEQTVVMPEAQIGTRCRLSRAVVESSCSIPSGTMIGEDATADAERFAISAGGVALVTGKSLLRAERQVP